MSKQGTERIAARYDAFLSYATDPDEPIAAALDRSLRRLAKPWRRRRTVNVFRDRSKMGAEHDLWESIRTALDETEWLVLLASPAATESVWVRRELDYWFAHRGPERLLLVLCGGSLDFDSGAARYRAAPDSAAPPELVEHIDAEPMYVDLRWAAEEQNRERLDLDDPSFRLAVAQIQASVRGIPLDDVVAEDLREFRAATRRRRVVTGVLAALVVALAAISVVAIVARSNAERRATEATARAAATSARSLLAQDPAAAASAAIAAYGGEPSRDHLVLLGEVARSGLVAEVDIEALDVSAAAVIDSSMILIGGRDGRLGTVGRETSAAFWEAQHTDVVTQIVVSGGTVVTAARDGEVRTWALSTPPRATGQPMRFESPVSALAVNDGGSTVAIGTADGSVHVSDIGVNDPVLVGGFHGGPVRTLEFSGDSRRLVSTSLDAVVEWGTESWTTRRTLRGSDADLTAAWVAAGPTDNGGVVALTSTGELVIWTATGQTAIEVPSADQGLSVGVGVAGPPRLLSIAGDVAAHTTGDRQVRFWSLEGGHEERGRMPVASGALLALGLAGTERDVVVITSTRARWWRWDDSGATRRLEVSSRPLRSVAVASNLAHAVGSEDGRLVVFDPDGSRWEAFVEEPVRGLGFSPTTTELVIAEELGALWRRTRGSELVAMGAQDEELRAVMWAPDGREVAVAGGSGTVHRYAADGSRLESLDAHSASARGLAYHPDPSVNQLFTAGSDGHVKLWDLSGPTVVDELVLEGVPAPAVMWIALDPGGTRLALGLNSGLVAVWVPDTDELIEVTTHVGRVRSVAWDRESRFLVSAGVDQQIRVFDGNTLEPFGPAIRTSAGVEALVLAGQGELLSVHLDGVLRSWNLDPGTWPAAVCEMRTRSATAEPPPCPISSNPGEQLPGEG